MKKIKIPGQNKIFFIIAITLLLVPGSMKGQNYSFGIFADPVISWFSSNSKETKNEGARPGFNFGVNFNWYFAENYSLSTGLNILNTGGRLYNTDTITMVFNNLSTEVLPGDPVVYRIQYISLPLGLKFESNQIGYIKIFTDLGFDLKYAIGGKADIPSESIEGEVAMNELNSANISYHILAGISYSLGGKTEFVFGLGLERLLFDITNDIPPQPEDKIKNNLLKFRLGLNF